MQSGAGHGRLDRLRALPGDTRLPAQNRDPQQCHRVDSAGPHVVRKYPVARSALFKTPQDACLANLLVAN